MELRGAAETSFPITSVPPSVPETRPRSVELVTLLRSGNLDLATTPSFPLVTLDVTPMVVHLDPLSTSATLPQP